MVCAWLWSRVSISRSLLRISRLPPDVSILEENMFVSMDVCPCLFSLPFLLLTSGTAARRSGTRPRPRCKCGTTAWRHRTAVSWWAAGQWTSISSFPPFFLFSLLFYFILKNFPSFFSLLMRIEDGHDTEDLTDDGSMCMPTRRGGVGNSSLSWGTAIASKPPQSRYGTGDYERLLVPARLLIRCPGEGDKQPRDKGRVGGREEISWVFEASASQAGGKGLGQAR
ncbi:hypothetical protein VTK73DRAFT_460 [Phialemonium thermophilum]|uniref:Uncharacterized protein n=1 Tax=Phialemonium thermophilum TaxID=223376 RepID=A0ABR3VV66_9PEZI